MTIHEVKMNLNQKVLYNDKEYIFTGCTIRVDKNGNYYYQAELKDLSAISSLLICKLEEVEKVKW